MSPAPSIPETFASRAPGELLISRTVAAPRELVFDVWTQSEHLKEWWGPRDFPAREFESDARPGGAFRMVMVGPGGIETIADGEYEIVERPSRLVGRSRIEHEGRRIYEQRVTVTFDQLERYTRLVVETEVLHNDDFPGVVGAKEGWSQQLDRLTEYLVGLR